MLFLYPILFTFATYKFLAYFGSNILFDRTYYIKNKIRITNEKYFSFLLRFTKKSMLFGMLVATLIYAVPNIIGAILMLFTPLVSLNDLIISLSIGFTFILGFFIMFICCICHVKSWKKINQTFEVPYEKFYEDLSKDWENVADINLDILKEYRLMVKTDSKLYTVRRIMSFEQMTRLINKYKNMFSVNDVY